jgi:beta-phosphoglucomutase-like phosphatase (HAD superfamily)
MPLEALIFDVDGTLAETEELHRQAFNETFARFELDWTWSRELYRELLKVTGGKERIRHYVEGWQPNGGAEALTRVAELHVEKTRRYTDLVAEGALAARPGVLRLLHDARAAGVKLAIATTTSLANIEALLKASFAPDALSWFAAIGAGDMVPAKKPAPDVYNLALKQLGCDPSTCIAFEDSENGVRSARAAGLPVVVTPSVYTDGDNFAEAVLVLSHLGDVDKPSRQIAGPKLRSDLLTLDDLRNLPGERASAA